jgi:hypothetical protein
MEVEMPRFLYVATLALTLGTFLVAELTPAAAEFQRAPTRLTTPGKGKKIACNGKTKTQCCEGISYCGCLASPMGDDDHPIACWSSPPKN